MKLPDTLVVPRSGPVCEASGEESLSRNAVDAPKTVKHYEILSRLGKGGMGVVYRARDTRLGRIVALKMLPSDVGTDEEQGRRFEREARIISAISHPNIATLYDFDRDGDCSFLTMEFVEGPTLRELLKEGPLSPDRMLECAAQVAEAMVAAHKQGIVHRDLKPENIMLSKSGHFKVLDFGVARQQDLSGEEVKGKTQQPTLTWATRAGTMLGTVAYMSPEQTLGQPTDPRSDIFSFGSLLYELATGLPAFPGKNEIATAQSILAGNSQSLEKLPPWTPDGVELVIQKCLAVNPDRRYQSAVELSKDLQTLQRDSLSGGRSLHLLEAYRPIRNRRWVVAGGTAVLAILLGVLAWISWPNATLKKESERALPPAGRPGFEAGSGGVKQAVLSSTKPRVIVAFFENNSGDKSADWLSRGLPEMLTTDLSRSESLEVIATQRIYDLLSASGKEQPQKMDRSTTAELAHWAGADLVISGSVFKAGSQYRIDAQVYDTQSGTVVAAHKVEGTELFDMVGDLTAGLVEGMQLGTVGDGDLQQVTTSSEEAFQLYVRGKDLLEELSFTEAASHFERALAVDSGFGVARLHLAMAQILSGEEMAARISLREAAEGKERMPEDSRLLMLALLSFYETGDFERGTEYMTTLFTRYPGEKDAYLLWAKALGDLKGDHLHAAQKLRRAIDLDPNYLPAVAALAAQLAYLGAEEDAVEMLKQAIVRNPKAEIPLNPLITRYGG